MANVAPGIITNGLGGDASNMILGSFNLGFFGAVIIIEPPVVKKKGGGGGGFAGLIPYRGYQPYGDEEQQEQEEELYQKISFVVRYKHKTWLQNYYWKESTVKMLFKVTSVINNITSNMKFKVTNFRKILKDLRIKR